VVSVISFLYAFSQKKYLQNNPFAIVMDGSVSVKSSPSVSGKELFVLHEGTKIEVLSSDNNWNEISLPDGKIGWLKAETVEGI
jgi:SH3-like domain-containing protein